MWVSSGRRPMRSPPGAGNSARPARASRGPARTKLARIMRQMSGEGPVLPSATARISSWDGAVVATVAPRSCNAAHIVRTSWMSGTLLERDALVGQQGGRQHGQGGVLVARHRDLAAEGLAAVDDEAGHGCRPTRMPRDAIPARRSRLWELARVGYRRSLVPGHDPIGIGDGPRGRGSGGTGAGGAPGTAAAGSL